jgi:hypothetical protein
MHFRRIFSPAGPIRSLVPFEKRGKEKLRQAETPGKEE